MKSVLASKVAGATHDYPALLPQVRMEYMQRRHATTGHSPNDLVYATAICLPPAVGPLQWHTPEPLATVGSAQLDAASYLAAREQRAQHLMSTARVRILRAQRSNADLQATRLAA